MFAGLARLLCALAVVWGHAAAGAEPITVGVDFSALDDATYRRLDGLNLEKRLVLRLLEEGFALVPRDVEARVRVAVRPTASGLELSAPHAAPRVVASLKGPVSEVHLEIVQKVVAVVRDAASQLERVGAPVEEAPPPVAPAPSPVPSVTAPSAFDAPPFLAASISGGAVLRAEGGPDLLLDVGASVRLAKTPLWLELAVGWVPSASSGLSVHEGRAGAVVSWRQALGPRWWAGVGLGGGAWLHTWSSTRPGDIAPTGARLSPSLRVPVLVAFLPAPAVGIGLHGALVVNPLTQTHAANDAVLWSRGPLGAELGLRLEGVWR